MRSAMSGCVARSADDLAVKVWIGLTMNRCWVARLTPGKGAAAAASLVRAAIRPLGLRVNWTEVASARYSRWRDTAICTALAAIGAMIATTSSTITRRPAPLLFLSLLLLLREQLKLPQRSPRKVMSAIRA